MTKKSHLSMWQREINFNFLKTRVNARLSRLDICAVTDSLTISRCILSGTAPLSRQNWSLQKDFWQGCTKFEEKNNVFKAHTSGTQCCIHPSWAYQVSARSGTLHWHCLCQCNAIPHYNSKHLMYKMATWVPSKEMSDYRSVLEKIVGI